MHARKIKMTIREKVKN